MQRAQQKFLTKVQKTRKIGKNMDFWDIHAFSDDVSMTSSGGSGSVDVSMTSSGDVAAYEWSTGVVRWQTGGAMADGGADAAMTLAVALAVTLARGLVEAGNRRRYHIAPLMIRKGICQRGLRYAVGATRGRGLTLASDKYRTLSFGRRGRSDIHESRWMKSA